MSWNPIWALSETQKIMDEQMNKVSYKADVQKDIIKNTKKLSFEASPTDRQTDH